MLTVITSKSIEKEDFYCSTKISFSTEKKDITSERLEVMRKKVEENIKIQLNEIFGKSSG